ncbi:MULTISPECIES: recombinase family protein [Actinomadura]|jgi:DNA invertase Pin-like site-specific DNA recombinase|uniref:recombinase family protein n=1 Tax=Actinomadura TaxID=1988 RepID=UPI00262B567F|nr:recombinase family protein [Actinomadura geliboluensis]
MKMPPWSKWTLHPDLANALKQGNSFEDWLGEHRPGASYARISKDLRQEIGVKRQHENNDEFAAHNNVVIVVRYTDNGITAVDPDLERPAFLRLVRDIRARRCEEGYPIAGVIAVEPERIVRLPEDYLKLNRALTVDEDGFFGLGDAKTFLDVHGDSEILRHLLASAMGELEVKKIKQRVSRNSRDKAKEGRPFGRGRFGWLPADPASKRQANESLDPDAAPIVRKAIDMRLQGKSWRAIGFTFGEECLKLADHFQSSCDFQTAEKYRKRAEQISTNVMQYMVTNPANCGYRMIENEMIRDRETGEPVIGKWETICTPQEWEKLVLDCPVFFNPFGAIKKSPTGRGRPAGQQKRTKKEFADQARKHLSSGILRCGRKNEFGETCYGRMNGSNGKRQALYKCNSPSCGRLGRRMDLVDETIQEIAIKALLQRYANQEPENNEWYGAKTLEKLQQSKAELKSRLKAGTIDDSDLFDLLSDLDLKIQDAEADRAQFEKEQASKNFLSRFSIEKWDSWGLRQRRTAIDAVLSAVIVLPIPEGRTKRAPFDPSLLIPVWRKSCSASPGPALVPARPTTRPSPSR